MLWAIVTHLLAALAGAFVAMHFLRRTLDFAKASLAESKEQMDRARREQRRAVDLMGQAKRDQLRSVEIAQQAMKDAEVAMLAHQRRRQ